LNLVEALSWQTLKV